MSNNAGSRLDHVDPTLTALLVEAADKAYEAGKKREDLKEDGGWAYHADWKCYYSAFGYTEGESCGIVWTRRRPDGGMDAVVAFRGTYSVIDILGDLDFPPAPFKPFRGSAPEGVRVGTGWQALYETSNSSDPAQTDSEQASVFKLLQAIQPVDLYITGHSLGAAVAAIFTYDLSLSGAQLDPPVTPKGVQTMLFSSPCPGDKAFAEAYGKMPQEGNAATRTVHVYNRRDAVPCYPLDDAYYAVGDYFLVDFVATHDSLEWLYYRHSVDNLQAVLSCALPLKDQVYKGKARGKAKGDVEVTSSVPPKHGESSWCTEHYDEIPNRPPMAGG